MYRRRNSRHERVLILAALSTVAACVVYSWHSDREESTPGTGQREYATAQSGAFFRAVDNPVGYDAGAYSNFKLEPVPADVWQSKVLEADVAELKLPSGYPEVTIPVFVSENSILPTSNHDEVMELIPSLITRFIIHLPSFKRGGDAMVANLAVSSGAAQQPNSLGANYTPDASSAPVFLMSATNHLAPFGSGSLEPLASMNGPALVAVPEPAEIQLLFLGVGVALVFCRLKARQRHW